MISNKTQELVKGSSLIRAMFAEGNRLKAIHGEDKVYDFSLGNPSVAPPKEIEEAIQKFIKEDNQMAIHGYMNNSGYETVRGKIANSINRENETNYNEENIIMTVGAAGGLNIIFKTILNPNDEVVVIAPFFSEYVNYVDNYNGKTVIVPADTESFQINFELLEKSITKKTKAVIINSPNNPSGAVYTAETLQTLSSILTSKEKEFKIHICLISDEPYKKIVYNNVEIPFVPHFYKNTFVAYSYSKSLSLPGERIGYIIVPGTMDFFQDVCSGLNVSNRILGFVNAPSLFQKVIGECVDVSVDITPYEENFNILYDNLIKFGYDCIKPNGTFYLFPRCPIEDDVAFCEKAKEYNLLLVPGTAFRCPGFFRISYCTPKSTVINSLPVFEKLINFYK